MSSEAKLTKKERKAQQFRKSKDEREVEKSIKDETKSKKRDLEDDIKTPAKEGEGEAEQPKKKRKTRRGKKGKGVNEGKGPRFILFAGNLPYDIKEEELLIHFKNAKPDRLRIRKDKGIAFLEFDNDTKEIQSKMELALRMHHSVLKDRKINVELTVGGGGNSENRVTKLKDKNDKLIEERRQRVIKDEKESREKKRKQLSESKANGDSKNENDSPAPSVHPSRAALMK